jgi:integrase
MEAIRQSDFIFSGIGGGRLGVNSLSELLAGMVARDIASVHGFRSTFRDWAAERTSFPRELAEMALAHSVGSDVEQAYRRTDLFDKRRRLLEEWAKFCGRRESAGATITPLRSA